MAKQVYNRLVDKDIYEKVNRENKDMMEDFLLELKAQKRSEGTCKQYKNDLKIFFCWIYKNHDNKEVYKLTRKQLRNFILYLSDLGMSSNRVNRIKSTISSFLTHLENDDELDEQVVNHMAKVKSVDKELVRDIIFISTEQVDYVRSELINQEKYQICLLWDILTSTGIRHNEVFQIQKDWIVPNDNKTTQEVIGKRKKKFKVCIHTRARESFDLYMKQRGEDDVPQLWINNKGQAASYEAIYLWILECRKILSKHEGKDININVHSLRHYFIDGMIKNYHFLCKEMDRTFTLQQVQAMVSHSSSETTSSYCKKDDEDTIDNAFGW